MRIAFRTDASSEIGTGHFMRCLALADALKQGGAIVRFVCRHLPVNFQETLVTHGHELCLIGNFASNTRTDSNERPAWLGVSQAQDASDTVQALGGLVWRWMIIDHYALDIEWEGLIRNSVRKIMVIDDLADRLHDCDVLLDQNVYSDFSTRYSGKVPANTRLLLGPKFALLREEFRLLRKECVSRRTNIKRAFVFLGGVDVNNYTSKVISALSPMHLEHVDVVIGVNHPEINEIKLKCREVGFTCHIQTDHIGKLMSAADLAIGAGGSAGLERCCLGLPALIFVIAANQKIAAEELSRLGVVVLGNTEDVQLSVKNVLEVLNEPHRYSAMSNAAARLVDGDGVVRVCEFLSGEY